MRWILFLGLAWGSDPSLEVRGASIEELDSLARQKAWSEMVFRLKEVPAADRNARWEALVEKAALGHLDTLGDSEAGGIAAALLDEYPSLRRSRKYLDKRTEVTFAALRKCYENPFIEAECSGRLLDFARKESGNKAILRRAAGIVAEKESAEATLPFLKLALAKGLPDRVCREEFWQKAVIAALGSEDAGVKGEGRTLASHDCWPQLKARLGTELDRKPSSLGVLCEVLKEKKSLTPERKKLCPEPANAADPS